MENELILSTIENLETFGSSDTIKQRIDEFIRYIMTSSNYQSKLYAAISKRLQEPIDNISISGLNLPIPLWCEIIDEIFEKQNDLITTSQYILPYSLIPLTIESTISSLQTHSNSYVYRAFQIVKEFTSENTRLAHMKDLIYWQAWLSGIGFSFHSPVTKDELLTFIIQHIEGLEPYLDKKLVDLGYKQKLGPHKLATIKRKIASLSVFLENAKWPNPCRDKEIKQLLQKLTKKYGVSKPAGKAITKDILNDMLETCKDKLIDIRDRALLLFAWGSGGRRRSEVTAADMKDLTMTPEGDFIYTIPESKTDQEGKGSPVPIKGRVAKALKDWLAASQITSGPIFRSISKGSTIKGALLAHDIYCIVKKRLKKAGYDEDFYTAHGLRSGFVTEAGRKGKALGDVMALTTHRSVSTVMRYYQSGNIINNSAGDLAD